jgi:hypothetical protein
VKAIVFADIAPLYARAHKEAPRVDEALFGMVVEIESDAADGFVLVRTHYGYEGYTPEENLWLDEAAADQWQAADKWCVWAPYLDILAEPKVQAVTIAHSPRGGRLLCCEEGDWSPGWVKVGLPNGRRGYVRKPCISRCSESARGQQALRNALVRTAKLYLGTQYRWGGKTPLGIDCSGLTSMVYMLNGVLIYRDAELRPEFAMQEIAFEKKAAGDLVFFPGHVAMYIGNGEFIHSTASAHSEGVVLNSFDPNSLLFRKDLLDSVVKVGSIF